jgi:hypothetical protein
VEKKIVSNHYLFLQLKSGNDFRIDVISSQGILVRSIMTNMRELWIDLCDCAKGKYALNIWNGGVLEENSFHLD